MLTANLAITLMIGLRLSTASGSVGPSRAVVYHYGTTSMSWEHAASYCARRGWRLAQFNSDYDLSALKHLFSNIGIVWIGLASTESGSMTYRWTDCTPYGDHTRAPWAVNEPNSLDSQLCVMMKAFTFKTNDCSKPFKFLCEEIQEAGTCMFTNPAFFESGTERTDGAVMSAEINCQQACLEYQEVKQCVGYSYYDKMCELYLGQFLIFPNSTSGAKPHVSVKVCHSYQTIDDNNMDLWDEPFLLSCDEGLPEESMSNEFADGITEATYSAITDGLTSSSLSSSSVTMVTTTAIPPTSYHLQSSNMLDTGLDSTVTHTAALPSPTIQEVTNELSRAVASTSMMHCLCLQLS
ncbi:uncharacterized protein LOC124267582 [Haliotis rubra]|uniref:uncharacterized protein LOC124267582 n=1 Tax=Haliotis rubra TaxID=36100 RepID=UPI001EE4F9FF|nr:uncharacterized protein LOC124267582 [Haliotis rubra]